MSNEAKYRFHARMIAQSNAMQVCRDKLMSAETQIENLIDDSNPNKDALRDMKNIQDLLLQARIVIEEANK